jgi:GAF domain-containing protein
MNTATHHPVPDELELICEEDFHLLLKAIFRRHGVSRAIAFLNGMSAHACTGLYRLDGNTLTNLLAFARDDPSLTHLPPLPLNETYCERVVESNAPFVVQDALVEDDLLHHPNRETVRSYAGVPIAGEAGQPWGTVCHFDASPYRLRPRDISRLQTFAGMMEASEMSNVS